MSAGPKRHRVTVQRPQEGGEDDYGNPIPGDPLVLARVAHAQVSPLTGREFFDAQQIAAQADRRVVLRWQPALDDLRPADQVVFKGRVLNIQHVANLDERNRELELLCRELV